MTTTTMTTTTKNQITTTADITQELADRYIAYLDVAPKTAEIYRRQVRLFVEWLQKNGISHPDRSTILAWKSDLTASGHTASTIQTYLTSVRLFFSWLESEGIYPNICDHIKAPKVSHEHHRDYLTPAQINMVLDGIDRSTSKGLRDYAIVYLTVTCGLRVIELSRAQIRDLRPRGSQTVLYIHGKDRDEKVDYVQVSPAAEKAVRSYLTTRPGAGGADPLFASESHRDQGEPMTTRSLSRIIKTAYQNVGLDSDRLTAHSLRHSAVTLAILGGESIQATQQFARHQNISTTEIYFHELDKSKNTCTSSIESMLKEV